MSAARPDTSEFERAFAELLLAEADRLAAATPCPPDAAAQPEQDAGGAHES